MAERKSTRRRLITDSKRTATYPLERVRNRIIVGDALEVLPKLPAECADCVFIDPPYFLQLPPKKLKRWKVDTEVEAVDDQWDKFASFAEYDAFIERLLIETKRVMKPKATIWVISTYHSIFRIGKVMQDLGYWLLNDVMWVKTNPMPNWLGVRFTNATETLIFAVKDKGVKGYTFNKAAAKKFGVGKVGANVWTLPLCTGKERLRNKKGEKAHSTQKPLELLRRVLLTSTNEGDLVLDPVAGVGTTGAAAQELERDFVMIEANATYAKAAAKRLAPGQGLDAGGSVTGIR